MKKINIKNYIYLIVLLFFILLLNVASYINNDKISEIASFIFIIIFSFTLFIFLYDAINAFLTKKHELIRFRNYIFALLIFLEYFIIKYGYELVEKICKWSVIWNLRCKIIATIIILSLIIIFIIALKTVFKNNNKVKENGITNEEFERKFKANSELTNKINSYYSNNNIDGAILIDGPWGSGKTYFIKNYIELFNQTREDRAVYVSLNGLKSIDEVNNALFAALHPVFSSVKNSPILKVLNCATKYSADLLQLDIESLAEIRIDIRKYNANLIVFDDVERCQVDIPSLFGYIDLIKSSCNKIILVADEKELKSYRFSEESYHNKVIASNIYIAEKIENNKKVNENDKNDNKMNDILYALSGKKTSEYEKTNKELEEIEKELYPKKYYEVVKEKIIWNTYPFEFDINVLFDSFVNNEEYIRIKGIINNSVELITQIEEKTTCSNLRTYKCALDYLSEIYDKLELSNVDNKDDIIELVLVNIFTLMIHYKHPQKFPFDNSVRINKKDYKKLNSFERFNDSLIVDFNKLENELMIIDREINEAKKNDTPVYILNLREMWVYMSDEYLTENINSLIEAYKNDELKVEYYALCYHYLYAYKNEYKFDLDLDLDEVKNNLIKRIEKSDKYVERDDYNIMKYQYYKGEEHAILEIYKALDTMNQKYKTTDIKESVTNTSGKTFKDFEKISNQAIGRRAFISLFSNEELMEFIRKTDNETLEDFRLLIHKVYGFSNINDYFEDDRDSIDALIKSLEKYQEECESKTKCKIIEWIIPELKEILSRL